MKWRILAALVALTAVVLIIQDVPLAAYLRTVESNRIVTEIQRDAFVIAGRSEQVLQSADRVRTPALQELVDAYSREQSSAVLVLNDQAQAVVASPPVDPARSYAESPGVTQALAGQVDSGEVEVNNVAMLFVTVPVLSGARTLGAVQVLYPGALLDQRVNERIRGIAIVAGLTMIVAIGIAFILAATMTRPILRLRNTTDQLSRGDLAARADPDSGAPEIRELASDLNSMATRLQTLLEAQRSFASDASHQLRTPLTALRIRLDQAADELESDPERVAETLDEARAETERLQHVIDGLLRLAKSEGKPGALVTVDLAAVVRERITIWEPLADEHDIALTVAIPATAPIRCAPEAAEQILDNYLDNAISISPAGTTVRVTITSDATSGEAVWALVVSDQGPGLTAEQRARAFDRFWSMRVDNAGTGLGLAIVRQLADASEATVELREAPNGGIDAVARFQSA